MRLRKKADARPELESCDFFIKSPIDYIGSWNNTFEKKQELWIELGCGKGLFISQLAVSNPNINFLAIDIKDEILVVAKRKIENEYSTLNAKLTNIKLMAHEIMIIHKVLNENDNVNRIYINFCNPWYKNHHRSKRLTHPNQLKQYYSFLATKGQIRFKTDNTQLFFDSINYFASSNFKVIYQTEDLINSGFDENIQTEHEKMYIEKGEKIKFLIAEKT
jgi:tRNA (guanine-N7-)-methyltransferase